MDDLDALVERLRALIAALRDTGDSRAAMVRAMRAEAERTPHVRLSRARFLTLMGEELGMSKENASSCFYSHFRSSGSDAGAVDVPGAAAPDDPAGPAAPAFPVESVRESLKTSTDAAVQWYLTRSVPVSRQRFLSRSGIADAGRGAVYSYHAESEAGDQAIYVGITGYRVKSRLYTPTSPHARSAWWDDWDFMRFVPVEAAGDRQILELLLIVGFGPLANQKPSAIDVDTFLRD